MERVAAPPANWECTFIWSAIRPPGESTWNTKALLRCFVNFIWTYKENLYICGNFNPKIQIPVPMSLDSSKFVGEGLTYDDVLLVPAYSEILPREVKTTTNFTKKIKLNTPIVSAAMDTVTEYQLAIAIAQEGGIGVLHKNMSIEEQAAQVRKV